MKQQLKQPLPENNQSQHGTFLSKMQNMPLEEKIAQLQGGWLRDVLVDGKVSLEKCRAVMPHGVGHICQFGSTNTLPADQLAQAVYDVQQYLLQKTESKIPALFHEEVINGVAAKGATVTPQMLGMACSFRPELVKTNAKHAGENIRKLGAYYALSPMMDIITDARWGRGEEGFGEDSYLVSAFADAFIEGLQSTGVGATAKHYAGYGVENQEEDFFINETLAPFEVAVSKSNVACIMPGYHLFHDVPASCSAELLCNSLRDHLGFTGTIVSDYNAISNIHKDFHYTETAMDSAILALRASVDVDLPNGGNYAALLQAVQEGRISEQEIDTALARVLRLKDRVMPQEVTLQQQINLDPPEYRAHALESAREAIVLLKNDGILPLSKKACNILVTGPNADSYYSLLGDYSWGGLAEFFRAIPVDRRDPALVTLWEGLQQHAGEEISLTFSRGFHWTEAQQDAKQAANGDERAKKANRHPLEQVPETDFEKTCQQAQESDIIIVAVGENRYLCGEATTRDSVTLPGEQEAYVKHLCSLGKPVILVVFGGRPMAITQLADQCAAVLYAWYPGEEGGNACAEILFGETNPSAKLATTFPDCSTDVPVHLNRNGAQMRFPFGFGLSYTSYQYSDVCMPSEIATTQESFEVQFTVTNTGAMAGAESTQLYLTNSATGTKKVIAFSKVDLQAGESKQVSLRVFLDQFGRYQKNAFCIVGGVYQLELGCSSVNIIEHTQLTLAGGPVQKAKRTQFLAQASVTQA